MISLNLVKEKLQKGEPSFGSWIQLGHPGIAEILANAGFDWIGVDCEHTDIDVKGFIDIARGMYGRSALPMARVRENDTLAIRQVLDAGAAGVIIPMVNCADDAKRAVSSSKFPPIGIRGSAFFRANNYGMSMEEYSQNANENLLVIVMVETKQAVDNIDEIVSVNGVDGVFIGPYDMSASYGISGQLEDLAMKNARKKILDACVRKKKAAGMHIVIPDSNTIVDVLNEGFTFVALGMDDVFIDKGARSALTEAKNVIGDIK